jgi:hypothetical protein
VPIARLTCAIAACAVAAAVAPRTPAAERPVDALVQLRPSASTAAARAAGGRLLSARLRVWTLPASAVASLRAAGAVSSAEPDRIRRRRNHTTAGDPLLAQEWWYARVGADRVEPPRADVPLTILDSGIDVTHADFAGRPDTTLLNEQTVDGAQEFHGTGVASVAAAPANGVGVVGVYPQARLLSWDASRDGRVTSGDVIAGLEAAAARGPGVVNISLGGSRSELEAQAVAAAYARGLIVVASAGNEGRNGSPPSYPGDLPHVVTVAATGPDDEVPDFSSRSSALDVSAPGVDVPIAVPTSYDEAGYLLAGGTSFASPIVAGALAWLSTVRPTLDKTQLVETVRQTARDLGAPGRDIESGFGLLDIPRALAAEAPPPDPLEPNDTVAQVSGSTSFPASRRPLTTPTRGRSTVSARLDVPDDPRDIYRLWAPARRRVVVSVRSSADVDLAVLGARPRTLTVRRREGATETLTVINAARRGRWLNLAAGLTAPSGIALASYTLAIRNAAVPR